jgi:hypothetical protein
MTRRIETTVYLPEFCCNSLPHATSFHHDAERERCHQQVNETCTLSNSVFHRNEHYTLSPGVLYAIDENTENAGNGHIVQTTL